VHEEPVPSESRYASTLIVRPGNTLRLRAAGDRRLELDVARVLP
jgi:hypothetical protein